MVYKQLKENKEIFTTDKYFVTALLMLIAFVFLRPAIEGNKFTPLGMVILCIALFYYKILGGKLKLTKNNTKIFGAAFVFWMYCLIQSLLFGGFGSDVAFKAVVINLTCLMIFSLLFTDERLKKRFVQLFILVLCLFAISYLITLVLSFFRELDSLKVFSVPIEGYYGKLNVLFPISVEYGKIRVLGKWVIRGSSIFREVGIAQLFYAWAYVMTDKYFFENVVIIRFLLVLGIVFCFSTTGYIIFISILLLQVFFQKGKRVATKFFLVLLSAIAIWAFMNVSGITLADKQAVSISDRTVNIINSLERLWENPIFGVGFCNVPTKSPTNICFLGNMYTIGVLGTVLHANMFLIPVFMQKKCERIKFCISLMPLVITGLFTQPLMDAPLVYMLLFF